MRQNRSPSVSTPPNHAVNAAAAETDEIEVLIDQASLAKLDRPATSSWATPRSPTSRCKGQGPRCHRQILRRDQPHRARRRRQDDRQQAPDRLRAAHRPRHCLSRHRASDRALLAALHPRRSSSATRRTISRPSPRRSRPSNRSANPRPKAPSSRNRRSPGAGDPRAKKTSGKGLFHPVSR